MVYWIYGPTAIGKSHYVRECHEPQDLYIKSSTNKWWDGYTDQVAVLLEEVEKADMDTDLKRWTDKYVFSAEVKGGTISNIAYSVIYLTSNYHPSELWKKKINGYVPSGGMNFNAEAIMRRLTITTIIGASIMVDYDEKNPPQKVVARTLDDLKLMSGTPYWVQFIPNKKPVSSFVLPDLTPEQIEYFNNNKI